MVAVHRVLLVEDEYLVARGIADEFARLGVETVGPAGSVKQALELVEHELLPEVGDGSNRKAAYRGVA
jgi:YesN/AraC family two-component response regulator